MRNRILWSVVGGLLLLLLLAGGGTYYWLFLRQSTRPVAECLPAETLFYATIPNATATALKYRDSNLRAVLESAEIQGLAALAFSQVRGQVEEKISADELARLEKLGSLLIQSFSGEMFAAWTGLPSEEEMKKWVSDPASRAEIRGLILGCRPSTGTGAFDPFLQEVEAWLSAKVPGGTKGTGEFQKYPYQWWQGGPDTPKICVAKIDGWVLTTIGEATLHDFLARYADKSRAGDSLARTPLYEECYRRSGVGQDAWAYVHFEPMVALFLRKMEKSMEQASQAGLARGKMTDVLKKNYGPLKAGAVGVRFSDRDLVEDIYVAYRVTEGLPLGRSGDPCQFRSLVSADDSTLFYAANSFDARAQYNALTMLYDEAIPGFGEKLAQFREQLKAMGIDADKNIIDTLGSELACGVGWPASSPWPDFSISLHLKKPDDFRPVFNLIKTTLGNFSAAGMFALTEEKGREGQEVLKITIPQFPVIEPRLVLSPDFVGLATSGQAVSRIGGSASSPLEQSEGFKRVVGDRTGAVSLVYLNSPVLLEKAYAQGKTWLPILAMTPGAPPELAAHLDKLPEKLGFLSSLGPWGMATRMEGQDGLRIRSQSGVGNQIVPFYVGLLGGVMTYASNMSGKAGQGADKGGDSHRSQALQIREDLREIRVAVEAWSKNQQIAPGTVVTWEAIQPFLIPDSELAASGGRDRLGNLYLLGKVGESVPDVSPETREYFSDLDDAATFWDAAP